MPTDPLQQLEPRGCWCAHCEYVGAKAGQLGHCVCPHCEAVRAVAAEHIETRIERDDLKHAAREALSFAGDMMQQLGWARQQSPVMEQEMHVPERHAYALFDTCWKALRMGPQARPRPEHGLQDREQIERAAMVREGAAEARQGRLPTCSHAKLADGTCMLGCEDRLPECLCDGGGSIRHAPGPRCTSGEWLEDNHDERGAGVASLDVTCVECPMPMGRHGLDCTIGRDLTGSARD